MWYNIYRNRKIEINNYMSGIVEVEADHEDDAHDEVLKNIGDYTGSLQYDEYGESIEVIKKIKN